MIGSDLGAEPRRRWSSDNGRTWSEFAKLPNAHWKEGGYQCCWGGGAYLYDTHTSVLVSIWLRQALRGSKMLNQSFSRISRDNGRTWSKPQLLRYEQGDDFPGIPPTPKGNLTHNQGYPGQTTIRHSNGTIIHALAIVNIPKDAPDPNPEKISAFLCAADERAIGSLCMIGKWNKKKQDYDWTAGKPVWLPRKLSTRGLLEPAFAELKDGRLLVIWRGSKDGLSGELKRKNQGRKLFSVSKDGGLTLSKPRELKYDDGSRFYSPSSIHSLIRHSVSGKLYWIGNISKGPASGNSPRYPLVIAEVDEEKVALKRSTVTIIDDRRPGEPAHLQLSNFSLLENRETHDFELYLTRSGELPDDWKNANAYKYTLSFGPSATSSRETSRRPGMIQCEQTGLVYRNPLSRTCVRSTLGIPQSL